MALVVNNASVESLFSLSSTSSVVTVNDPNPVELGVRFKASANGLISGLRFYEGPQNTGTHVADLWSSSGTLLATATFSNETAGGWQQVNFANPVAITAGATYTASYHTNTGEYSADPNLFAAAHTNGSLTAPASSGSVPNGVYAYGSGSLFPTNSQNSTSYGVDVLFKPQLAGQMQIEINASRAIAGNVRLDRGGGYTLVCGIGLFAFVGVVVRPNAEATRSNVSVKHAPPVGRFSTEIVPP